MKKVLSVVLLLSCIGMQAMDDDTQCSHNTYRGVPITPETLLDMAPSMPDDLARKSFQCLEKYRELVTQLVTTPHPLTHDSRRKKTTDNLAIIDRYEKQGEVKNHSDFNYVLQFTEYPEFSIPINRWGSRVAYLVYATDQGSVLDPDFQPDFDCSKFDKMFSFQHCSRVAHYLRLKEVSEKKAFEYVTSTPTYLQHIPGKSSELSDENYCTVQEWVPGLKELKQLPEREQMSIRAGITGDALQEMYTAIVYAALWDLSSNLAINGSDSNYYMVDLEETIFHKPQFFFFQGEEGEMRYVIDVVHGLEKMAQTLQSEPEQFNVWKRLTDEDRIFKALCEKHNFFPNYEQEYLDAGKYDNPEHNLMQKKSQ